MFFLVGVSSAVCIFFLGVFALLLQIDLFGGTSMSSQRYYLALGFGAVGTLATLVSTGECVRAIPPNNEKFAFVLIAVIAGGLVGAVVATLVGKDRLTSLLRKQ